MAFSVKKKVIWSFLDYVFFCMVKWDLSECDVVG